MLNSYNDIIEKTETGKFSVIETISVLEGKTRDFGWSETVVFFNNSEKFNYDCPNDFIDLNSGVICLPENYGDSKDHSEFKLRITHPANFDKWNALSEEEYVELKKKNEEEIFQNGLQFLANDQQGTIPISDKILTRDTFTPKTIKRFTSHENGTLYGSPSKSRDGSTQFKNLFLAGTDQGYIGIVGAMLGGIAIANNRILRGN